MAKNEQRLRGNTVAGRGGVIVSRLGTMDQRLVVMTGKEEATRRAILESFQQGVCHLDRPCEILRPERGLHQFEQRSQQKGVIVEVGVQMRAPVLVCGEQAPFTPQGRAQKVDGLLRARQPHRLVEDTRRAGQRSDHQRVPRRQ